MRLVRRAFRVRWFAVGAVAAWVGGLAGAGVGARAGEFRFTIVDSSRSSWVARGYDNYTVTPADGWTFTRFGDPDDGTVRVRISGPPLPGTSVDYWDMTFATPFYEPFATRLYENLERYPFQDAHRPGLSFSSTGRLDNMAAGFFEVLEVTDDSFAVNFTHYGETQPSRYALVELRYNSVVPEPSAVVMLLVGGVVVLCRRGVRREAGEVGQSPFFQSEKWGQPPRGGGIV